MTNADAIRQMIEALSEGRERYQKAVGRQSALFEGREADRQPLLLSAGLTGAQAEFPHFNYREIHYDREKMLANELRGACAAMNGGREAAPSVRANMGCGIVPALFGVMPRLFEDKMPWVKDHLPKEQLAEMRASDLAITEEFRAAMEHMDYMADALEGSGVRVYPVDIQGAFDTAHIVVGDSIFYELYDDPDFVHHLLDLSCAAIKLAFDECLRRMPGSDDAVPHYNALAIPRSLGGIKLSEDTSTLLNKEQVEEFVVPYMRRALNEAGGGYIHYCGKNPHLYQAVLDEPLARGLNFGNPDMHDMRRVLGDCANRGILYYGGIPQKEGEDIGDHFSRLLAASEKGGRAHLLLCHSCDADEAEMVGEIWDKAAASV